MQKQKNKKNKKKTKTKKTTKSFLENETYKTGWDFKMMKRKPYSDLKTNLFDN